VLAGPHGNDVHEREEGLHRETGRKGERFVGKVPADLGVGAANPNPLFSLSPVSL
jgi:hypothetical protein